jgi:hypothetical protein
MKKTWLYHTALLFLVFALAEAPATQAQTTEPAPQGNAPEMNYLFSKKNRVRVSGFGAPIWELSFVNDKPILSSGFGGALLFNRKIFVGLYGLSSVAQDNDFTWEDGTRSTRWGEPLLVQTGLWGGYHLYPNRLIHFTFSGKLGYGMVVDTYQNPTRRDDLQGSLSFTPQVDVEANLFKWMKASVGVGYRWVGSNEGVFDRNQFSSPVVATTLSFGWFR